MQLLEYDKRFEQYGSDFIFYDYNQPEELPLELKHAYGIVVADPPYLVSLFVYSSEYLITGPFTSLVLLFIALCTAIKCPSFKRKLFKATLLSLMKDFTPSLFLLFVYCLNNKTLDRPQGKLCLL